MLGTHSMHTSRFNCHMVHWPTWRSRYWCDGQLLSPASCCLPPAERIIANDRMCRQHNRCADESKSVNVYVNEYRCICRRFYRPVCSWTHLRTARLCCTYVRAFVDASVNADASTNMPTRPWTRLQALLLSINGCVKLRILVSHYVSNCRHCWWWDKIPILYRLLCAQPIFLADAKMFVSIHVSSAERSVATATASGLQCSGCSLYCGSWVG